MVRWFKSWYPSNNKNDLADIVLLICYVLRKAAATIWFRSSELLILFFVHTPFYQSLYPTTHQLCIRRKFTIDKVIIKTNPWLKFFKLHEKKNQSINTNVDSGINILDPSPCIKMLGRAPIVITFYSHFLGAVLIQAAEKLPPAGHPRAAFFG